MAELQKMFQKRFSTNPTTFIPKSNLTFEIIENISLNQIPIINLAQETTKSTQNNHNDKIKPNKTQKQPKS